MAKKAFTPNIKRTAEVTKLSEEPILATKPISLDLIDFNPLNRHGKNDTPEIVEKLAKDLQDVGLIHNVVCYLNPTEDGSERYMLISGERRTKAYRMMKQPTIMANIIRKPSSKSHELKLIISANEAVRKSSMEDRLDMIAEYQRLVEKEQEEGAFDESVAQVLQTYIVESFGVSQRQAERYVLINNSLSDEITNLLKEEKIDMNLASSIAALDSDCQEYALSLLQGETEEGFDFAKEVTKSFTKNVKKAIRANSDKIDTAKRGIEYRDNTLPILKAELGEKKSELKEAEVRLASLDASDEPYDRVQTEVEAISKAIEKLERDIEKGTSERLKYQNNLEQEKIKASEAAKRVYEQAASELREGKSKKEETSDTENIKAQIERELKRATGAINNLLVLIASSSSSEIKKSSEALPEEINDMIEKLQLMNEQIEEKK